MVLAPAVGSHITLEVIQITADEQCYERFLKMKPPNFRVVERMLMSS